MNIKQHFDNLLKISITQKQFRIYNFVSNKIRPFYVFISYLRDNKTQETITCGNFCQRNACLYITQYIQST
jgi:hypothetical protein